MGLKEFLVHSAIDWYWIEHEQYFYTNVTLTLAAHDVVVKWKHRHWYVADILQTAAITESGHYEVVENYKLIVDDNEF